MVQYLNVQEFPSALEALKTAGASPYHLLSRHQRGNWGDMDRDDWVANNRAFLEGTRHLSRYIVPGALEPIYIITGWDRSLTPILLPSEY